MIEILRKEFECNINKKEFRKSFNHLCKECGIMTKYGHIHHIRPLYTASESNAHEFNKKENLVYLCQICHKKKHKFMGDVLGSCWRKCPVCTDVMEYERKIKNSRVVTNCSNCGYTHRISRKRFAILNSPETSLDRKIKQSFDLIFGG